MMPKFNLLKDRSRRDILRFEGTKERDKESWVNTEDLLKDKLSETLAIQNIKIIRAHRVGDIKRPSCRTIVAKLSSCKTEERILAQAKKKKPSSIQIYEDVSKAANTKRKFGKGQRAKGLK